MVNDVTKKRRQRYIDDYLKKFTPYPVDSIFLFMGKKSDLLSHHLLSKISQVITQAFNCSFAILDYSIYL